MLKFIYLRKNISTSFALENNLSACLPLILSANYYAIVTNGPNTSVADNEGLFLAYIIHL